MSDVLREHGVGHAWIDVDAVALDLGDVVLDNDARDARDVAAEILDLIGW